MIYTGQCMESDVLQLHINCMFSFIDIRRIGGLLQ